MKNIVKYANTTDTQSKQYISQKEYVESLISGEDVNIPDDYRTPFSFQEWKDRNNNIIPSQEYEQYNKYLRDWHKNTYTSNDIVTKLRSDYIDLIKNLDITFTTPQEIAWLSDIDFSDELDLDSAIPLFAKKLKEIAIYFVNKRDAIKKAKLKYNMVGSRNSLERMFYEYLLKAFTRRDYVLNVPEQSAYNLFPALSTTRNGFRINIEELYDDTHYFDKDPSVDVTTYYNLTDESLLDYFGTKSFNTSALDWLFKTGITDTYAFNPLLIRLSDILETYNVSSVEQLPLSSFSNFDNVLLNDYVRIDQTNKYLGSIQNILTGGYFELKVDTFQYDFEQGNNWFYWTSGEYAQEVSNSYYDALPLTESTLISSGAIAASEYKNADRIFIEQSGTIKGAWLYSEVITEIEKTMEANILPFSNYNRGRGFECRFPFPGFDDIGSFSNLNSPIDRNITDEEYWTHSYEGSSINTISIHDTTLISSSANAASYYNDADKLYVKRTPNSDGLHDLIPNSVYNEDYERAWLYKFEKTDLPVVVGKNYINFPVHTYEKDSSTLSYAVPSDQCVPVILSSINVEETMVGSRAGYGLFDSDIIYKLDSWNGFPIECAFLSGADLNTLASPDSTLMYAATGKIQPSFTLRCRPGRPEYFLWQDSNKYMDETTIVHNKHQLDCPYLLNSHDSISKTKSVSIQELGTNGIGDWRDCECKAITYSPLGHPGNKFSDYNSMADFIFVHTQFPERFDIETWRGTDGLAYDKSKDFAWFHLLSGNPVEPDVGWGPGEWKTGDGSRFELKSGVLYQYVRANLHRNPSELILDTVPNLIIKQKHDNTPPAKWVRAVLDENGSWEATNEISPMVLNPSDYLMYDHIDSHWYCLSTEGDLGYTFTTDSSAINFDSSWANYTFVTPPINVSYNWPSLIFDGGPSHISEELSAVSWAVIYPDGTSETVEKIDPSSFFTFTVSETGVHMVEVSGFGEFGVETFSVTPNLISTPELTIRSVSGSLDSETIYSDRINMTINIPLTGWDYITKSYNPNSLGGKPFWATSYEISNEQTKNKGTRDWGGGISFPIDQYTPVTQPDISNMKLSLGDVIEYRNMGQNNILWKQPVDLNTNIENKKWCDLKINEQVTSPLSSYLYNLDKELVISATKTETELELSQICGESTFINYYSISGFTWVQELTDSSIGIPPTGGKWIEALSEILIDPLVPYANLTNRHYPTIATIPYIPNLHSYDDVGGYSTPTQLGALTYLGKQYEIEFDTSETDNVIYQDSDYYSNDYGLTKKKQMQPVTIADKNSIWMKSSLTQGARAGFVNNVKDYKEFIPYQSTYETKRVGDFGIRTINDDYTPWTGEFDNEWLDETNFPPNFRGEYPIESWYNQFPQIDGKMVQWKTDIFGNNYSLFKDRNITGIYNEKTTIGDLWVRKTNGYLGTATELLSGVYDKVDRNTTIYSELTSNSIYDFDLFIDTILYSVSGGVVLQRLNFDYDNGNISSLADNTKIIELSSNEYFAGYWYFGESNDIALCKVTLSDNIITPIIYLYDINSGELSKDYDGTKSTEVSILSSMQTFGISSIKEPLFTYNKDSQLYNISFTSNETSYGSGMLIGMLNVGKLEDMDTTFIIPSSYPTSLVEDNETEIKNIVDTTFHDKTLIFSFEGQDTGKTYISEFTFI